MQPITKTLWQGVEFSATPVARRKNTPVCYKHVRIQTTGIETLYTQDVARAYDPMTPVALSYDAETRSP